MSGTSAWPSIRRPACARQPMEGRSSCRPPPERPLENPRRPDPDSEASVDIGFLVCLTTRPSFRFRRRVYKSASHHRALAVARRRAAAPMMGLLPSMVSCSSRSSRNRALSPPRSTLS
jgi:hypothetical protein